MKKKVRIYKSPTGDGKYINKTSQFLAKAQMGGTPDPSMLSYPGAQPAQQEDPTNQLIQLIVNDISTQTAKEQTLFKLINVMGIAADAAAQLYEAIAEQVTQDIEKADDEAYEEETGMKREKSESLSKNEVITQRPEEDIDYDYDLNDDTGADMALETSNEPDVLDEVLDPLSEEYRYGGAYQTGGEYAYALPSPEEYSQYNPGSGYELASNMAWQSPVDTEGTMDTMNYANTTLDYSKLQNGGSYKKAKKKYVSSVMNLLKKQMGGQEGDSENPNNGDPTGANFRENKLQAFTNTVKQNAQMQAMQNQIEQQYDQMMQEGGVPQNDPENPMHHLNLYSQTASGIFGEPMNEMVKAQEGLNVPKGFYRRTMKRFGNMPNLREVDVRKSGLFGAPRQYTAYFDPMPLQQLNNPVTAGMYGYGASQTNQRKQKRTWDAEKVYTNLLVKETNKETLKEVNENTPGNEATTVKEEVTPGTTTPAVTPAPVTTAPVTTTQPVVAPIEEIAPVEDIVPPSGGYQLPSGSKQNQMDWAPGVTKIQQGIENPIMPQNIYNQKLPGKQAAYQFIDGEWQYWLGDEPFKKVTYQPTLDRLNNNESRLAVYGTLDAKPGYYYRYRTDGSFAKYKGDPKKHNKSSKPVSYITKGDKNYQYLKNNIKENDFLLNYKQQGGSIENPFANPMEPLQRFIGGGMEGDIDYTNSIDTTDPYFQRGGLIKQFVPANLVRNRQNDVVQKIYNPVTGESRPGMTPGAGNYISAIDVRRSSLLNTPKKYTVYYGAQGDPRYENLITLDGSGKSEKQSDKQAAKSAKQQALENAGYGQRTDVTGLKGKSKRAIKQGERQRDRELEKLYKEDPTNVAFTKIDENAPFDYEAQREALKSQLNMDYVPSAPNYNDVLGAGNELMLNQQSPLTLMGQSSVPQNATNQITAYQFPEGESDDSGWGTAGDPMSQVTAYTFPEGQVDESAFGQPRQMTTDFAPMSMEGPLATEEDQIVPFEQEYMQGYEPTITQEMLDNATQLQIPPAMTDMGAWSGMGYPAEILQPGVNPFDLPIGGGQDYYPPFAQPIAAPVAQTRPTVNKPSGPSLDQIRTQQQRNPNAGKDYTFKPNMAGIEKDPDYRRAMQEARKDGVVTNEEATNATRIFKQKQAEQEKAKVASQAQRTINQIMNSSASTAEKNKAREKVVLQMQQRWDVIDRAANSRKYGGALSRFVNGGEDSFIGENPVAYTNNPAMQGKSDLDLISLNSGIQGAQGQVNWGQLSPTNTVTQQNNDGTKSYGVDASYKGTQPTEIKVDPMQQEEYQVAKTYSEPLAIDVKNKLTQGEIEARLNTGNTLMRGITGIKNRRTDAQQMEGFYDNFSADNLYASDPSRDRGDYAESGLYRPDEQGQVWNSRSAQYGGYIGEDPDYVEGDETYMTEEEIRQYMAQGGQIEFI